MSDKHIHTPDDDNLDKTISRRLVKSVVEHCAAMKMDKIRTAPAVFMVMDSDGSIVTSMSGNPMHMQMFAHALLEASIKMSKQAQEAAMAQAQATMMRNSLRGSR